MPALHKAGMAAVLLLSACGKSGDDRICGSLAMKPPVGFPWEGNEVQYTTACVERWSSRLALADADPRAIAEGVLGACELPIEQYRVFMNKAGGTDYPIEAIRASWRRQSIFRIVQRRAGGCPMPTDPSD